MKPRFVRLMPDLVRFAPIGPDDLPASKGEPIYITYDEFEAFRLVFHEGLLQEEAARRMGISRGTLWRCLENARKKVASMMAEGRALIVTSEPSPEEPYGAPR
jgi:predicted DNA-binding protein (UPF0251 family)